MKLAKKLQSQLDRLFFFSMGLGVVVLLLSTIVSIIEVRAKSNEFITSHVHQIAQAQVTAQSITDIDREIRRLYDAWRETQDLDIRVEVYIDDKLVGKAGQLQSLGMFSSATSNSYILPSGQNLVVNVEIDLERQLVLNIMVAGIFLFFLVAGYILVRRGLLRAIQDVSAPLEKRISWLSDSASKLPDSIRMSPPFASSSIEELKALDKSLEAFSTQILALEERVAKKSYDEGQVKMAEQFAHSIKGTLGLLALRINNSKNLTEDEREKLISAVKDVTKASAGILQPEDLSRKDNSISEGRFVDTEKILEKLIAEKEEVLADRPISIVLDTKLKNPATLIASENQLASALGNILDNAVESIDGTGEIKIFLKTEGDRIELVFTDSGCGIPASVLPNLMKERSTFGKENGNGLGLYHSKLVIEDLDGKIHIASVENSGTTVSIILPRHDDNFSSNFEISVDAKQTLVVVDDQQIIHDTVKILIGKEPHFCVVHLKSPDDFETWIDKNGPGELNERIYWMDNDMKDPRHTGLSLIEKYGLQLESILVTGMADDPEIRARAMDNGVRLISKDDVYKIKFINHTKPVHEEINLGVSHL